MADNGAQEAAVDISVSARASIPFGDNSVWADVSPLLESACKDLRDGDLIHGDNFNLFAAMSALEIMDPKMDSGIVCKYYSVDEAIENGAAPVPISFDKTVDVQRTIDIMDHLLACEATWHKGHSLAQTVFSCIYLLRPDRTSSHALLHSYCRVIRATCKAVISVVSDARTHEEEDLFTMAYGLPLDGDGDEKCLSLLNAVEETTSRQLRACKAQSSRRRVLEDIEPLQTNLDLEEGYCKALLCRLRFRKHFYHVLTSMRRPQGRGLELARKHISSCILELECILKSSEFLRSSACGSCEDVLDDSTTGSGCQPVGFDASLNSRLSAPTPPRAIKILSWKKAIEYFVKLLHDLDILCSYSLDPLLEGVLQFLVQFQKSQPDLVARSHLQLLLLQDGKLYGRDSIFAVITRAAALPEVTKNHNIQKNEYIVQLGQLVINMLKILCTNAAWQRRKLGKMLQDWRVIYVQLELVFRKDFGEVSSIPDDENICVKIFQHILLWVEEQTYWIASRFLILGFELELYSPSEYCMVYWYIYVVLIKLAEKTHLKMATRNDTSKRKAKKKRDSLKDMGREYRIPPAVLFVQCQMFLVEGLTMLLAALANEHMIVQSPSPFNTEQERFIQHFELLQKACVPDHISYPSFKESTAYARFSTLVMYNYFKDAQRIAKEAKSSFANDPEKLAELRKIEQVAEHNSIALNVICRVGALDRTLKVSFEFGHHPYFATAVVKRS
ncbi:N-alpha-acetyltransferase 35, NatC auxiliary subunit isoform X1 [Juglans regia]|uniref:N-alpha-acetyltransferase 35, NatC auxiliary subunit isoform X1 n=2 Tax=Juglans regia TaxID=51240 RepID=A0A2I4F562_JUGRE|nr:N-alpha-acetyltransferase 35, NatC auxiliary subunit isoform X1 [Juglans regia]